MLLLNRGANFNANFYHQAGVDVPGFLLVDGKRKVLFVSPLDASIAKASFRGRVIVCRDVFASLERYLRRKTVFFDASSLSVKLAERLRRFCKLKDHAAELARMRTVKTDAEIAMIRRAVRHTKELLDSLDFRKARSELGLKRQILVATAELGLEPAFEPVVASGSNTSNPHHKATNRKLDSVVLVDCGLRYGHYCADLTRCVFPAGDRKKKNQYEALQNITHSIADKFPEMTEGRDVALLAAKLMKRAALPRMIHSIGHGIGLDVHELPRLNAKSGDKLRGSAFTLEPAFYLRTYGLRYEETLYFNGKKAVIL